MLYGTTSSMLEYLGLNAVEDLPSLKAIEEIIKHSPPDGVSQSDIDFYEEINIMKAKIAGGEIKPDDNAVSELITEHAGNEETEFDNTKHILSDNERTDTE